VSIAYLLRKILAPSLYPLSVSLELILVGLVLFWWTDRQKVAKWFVTAGALALVVTSYTPSAYQLLSPLERTYAVASLSADVPDEIDVSASPRWIVVLGGGYTFDPSLPATAQLSPASLARLVEGVRLYRLHPDMKMIISGGVGLDAPAEAIPIARTAEVLGVSPSDLILEDQSLDTEGQARRVATLVGSDPFFLVTSAAHLPRAMALFRQRGLEPTPAPADFEIKGDGGLTFLHLFPRALNTVRTEKAIYEYLGLAWGRLRGAL